MEILHNFLRDPAEPPAIKDAMGKAAERQEKGLEVANFASGNVGQLPVNMKFMDMSISTNKTLPKELSLLAEAIKTGIKKAFTQPRGLPYSPTGGKESQKQLALDYFKTFHDISHEDLNRVIVTAGGQRAMTAALRSLKPGTDVLFSKWEYAPISSILKNNGCHPKRVPVSHDLRPNLEKAKEKVSKNSVFYFSMPNNPSGYISPNLLRSITEIMVDHEGAVIWDAPYLFTTLHLEKGKASFNDNFLQEQIEDFKEIVREYQDHICLLSSISKTCLAAGLRFGFGTAPEKWVKNMDFLLGREDLSNPTASFIIGEEILKSFLEHPITYHWLDTILARRLSYLIEKDLPLILPENGQFGGLYVLMETGNMNGATFIEKATEKFGVIPIPGAAFYGEPINAVRLSLVSTPWIKNDKQWKTNVDTLAKAMAELL